VKTNTIKWDKEMAERCIRRASRYEDAEAVRSNAARSVPVAQRDHWEDFRKAMDQLLKG